MNEVLGDAIYVSTSGDATALGWNGQCVIGKARGIPSAYEGELVEISDSVE